MFRRNKKRDYRKDPWVEPLPADQKQLDRITEEQKRKRSTDSYINDRGERVELCIDQYDRIVCFAPFGKQAEKML